MEIIKSKSELFSQTSSKGNQIKFEKAGRFYKLDMFGYESISEVVCSELCRFIKDFEYVDYFLDTVLYKDKVYTACYSESFYKEGYTEVSFYRLLQLQDDLIDVVLKKKTGVDLLEYVVSSLSKITGISENNLYMYIGRIVYFDSIILNEDRHLNNLSLRVNNTNGRYDFMPVYDNGLSLLSDLGSYDILENNIDKLIRKVKSKPFSTSFNKQCGYFVNKGVCPLILDYDSLNKRLLEINNNLDDYLPFMKKEYLRAVRVLRKRLKELEGKLWINQ